jgi:hypothetical protein
VADSKAASAFTHDCRALYAANSAFQVDHSGHLHVFLNYDVCGHGEMLQMKRHLKRIEVTVDIGMLRLEEYDKIEHRADVDDFIIEDDDEDGALDLSDEDGNAWRETLDKLDMVGKVRKQLNELFECTDLQQVTILVKGESEVDLAVTMELIEQAVLPVARELRQNVQFVHVMHARFWSSSGQVELWNVVMSGQSIDMPDWKRDKANRRRRAKHFKGVVRAPNKRMWMPSLCYCYFSF